MAVQQIGIADKATLDLVKQDTSGILNNFPINGGTDFSQYTPIVGQRQDIDTTFKDIINITGKGLLAGVSAVTNSAHTYIKIVIDGVTIMDGTKSVGYSIVANLIGYIPFNTFVVVQAKNSTNIGYATAVALLK